MPFLEASSSDRQLNRANEHAIAKGSPETPQLYVNSFSQFKRRPDHAPSLTLGDHNHHLKHTLNKSVSTPVLHKPSPSPSPHLNPFRTVVTGVAQELEEWGEEGSSDGEVLQTVKLGLGGRTVEGLTERSSPEERGSMLGMELGLAN